MAADQLLSRTTTKCLQEGEKEGGHLGQLSLLQFEESVHWTDVNVSVIIIIYQLYFIYYLHYLFTILLIHLYLFNILFISI